MKPHRDISHPFSAETRLEALVELNDRLRDLEDPADIAYAAAKLLGETLKVSRAGYGTIYPQTETIVIERDWNAPGISSLAGTLHFRDYGSYIEDLKRGETVVFADAEKDPRTAATAKALKDISAQAVVNMPVQELGESVALLYLNHETARSWSDEELAFIKDVAERTRTISERRRVEQELKLRAHEYRAVFEQAGVGMVEIDAEWRIIRTNAAYAAMVDCSPEELVGKNCLAFTEPVDISASHDALRRASKGERVRFEKRYLHPRNGPFWIRSNLTRISGRNDAVRLLKIVEDIDEAKVAEQALQEQSVVLEVLNESGASIAAELDLERVVQIVTDAGVRLTGAEFGAFFYNVIDEHGGSYMLFTLSGAHKSQFDFGMPRATAVFHPTFAGEGVVRSDDITKDKRYGKNDPHFGMPKGHLPVVSYLAVPVRSRSGEVLGGLFFGHPAPGRFTAYHENLMIGLAAQAAIGIDNARLYQAAQKEVAERQRAEEALRSLNEKLEEAVQDEIDRRTAAEDQLRQAQKMEAVGQLTGGIAHDFNNLLQIIAGNLDILSQKIPPEAEQLRRYADRAAVGANRATTLTQRLLAFSRRQPLQPKPTNLNQLVVGMSDLLHRTLGENIEIESVLTPRLWTVEIDPNQFETAIVNLAVNARDAMPEGGKVTVETQNTFLDRDYVAAHPEVSEGQYVAVCISDTGTGMDAEVAAKAIEPFYTTKEVGRGTGLGLSMVYGFVKQSGGHFKIYSEIGEGTTVKIYLPRLHGDALLEEPTTSTAAPQGAGHESILVCEDDADVRAYTVEVLQELGYHVLQAGDGEEALGILQRIQTIDLLFTDVVLPGMSGAVLAGEAQKLLPGLRTLFTTGYARNAIVHHGRLDPGVELITKPFGYSDLALRVRDILDRPAKR